MVSSHALPLVYVASRASLAERAAMWRRLREQGAQIVSTWINDRVADDLSDLWVRIAQEVAYADRLVMYVETEDFPLKGVLIEVGMALALGKPVFIVAPGVQIDPTTHRPLGTWIEHPLVTLVDSVESAVFGDV